MHGIIEWLLLLAFAVAGFPLDRWVPAKRLRYAAGAFVALAAFIMDLNKVTFAFDILNIIFWSLLLVVLSELFWICARKKSRLLFGGALMMFAPVFVYVYFALIMTLPLPCHEDRREVISEYECPAGMYVLKKRVSYDIFDQLPVFVLTRTFKWAPWMRVQVDKYQIPQNHIDADFVPYWRCLEGRYKGGVAVDLYTRGYTLWSLKEEPKGD